MRFSPETSFIVGEILIASSFYCVSKAKLSSLPLALVPLFFGIQQLSEGIVWVGFHNNNQQFIDISSFIFLFFALAFWPVWVPFTAWCISKSKSSAWLTLFGSLFGIFLYLPLFQGILHVGVVHHSIQYSFPELPILRYLSENTLRLLYLLTVTLPMFSYPRTMWLGVAVTITALISHFFLSYAFVSLWCFFAAVIAMAICYFFHRENTYHHD